MILGYARVSTDEQNPQLQLDALIAAGVPEDRIWMDKLRQGGLTVVEGDAPTEDEAKREAFHYGAMYAQDGAVLVEIIPPRKRRTE